MGAQSSTHSFSIFTQTMIASSSVYRPIYSSLSIIIHLVSEQYVILKQTSFIFAF